MLSKGHAWTYTSRFDGGGDLAGQIYRQVRDAILDGRLRLGQPLPPTRELAIRLAVSRNTVSAAYDRLTGEGFVAGRIGAGTFVTGTAHPTARGRRRGQARVAAAGGGRPAAMRSPRRAAAGPCDLG